MTRCALAPIPNVAIRAKSTGYRMASDKKKEVEELLATPDLATALESEQFRHFLDHVPVAVVVAETRPVERIIYANLRFEEVSGQRAAEIEHKPWTELTGSAAETGGAPLCEAVVAGTDRIGVFRMDRAGADPCMVEAFSNIIEDDDGTPVFRLVALVDIGERDIPGREKLEQQLAERDTALREIQHRVKNNLQIITALIRMEARNDVSGAAGPHFERLAGRINALYLLYETLSEEGHGDDIDLGVYLTEIATAVMKSHAVEGIRLDLKVDTYPVSINAAMPAGLVVNELLTNALKYAFVGRDGGTIRIESIADERGCRVLVADDGVGLPEGAEWPRRGKLSALIVQSLRVNARASVEVESRPGQGVRVTIGFTRAAVAPEPA